MPPSLQMLSVPPMPLMPSGIFSMGSTPPMGQLPVATRACGQRPPDYGQNATTGVGTDAGIADTRIATGARAGTSAGIARASGVPQPAPPSGSVHAPVVHIGSKPAHGTEQVRKRLREMQELLEAGFVTQEEFDAKRRKLMQ